MSELYGYMDDGDVLNGGMDEIAKVVGHSDWGEIGGQLSDQEDLQDALDKKADKARVDILEKLTLGQVWDYDPYDETVYQQTVPAGGHGVEMESVGGRSVVWNQLCPEFTNEFVTTGNRSKSHAFASGTRIYANHKYLVECDLQSDVNYTFQIYVRLNGTNIVTASAVLSQSNTKAIVTSSQSGMSDGTTYGNEGNTWIYNAIASSEEEHYANASDHRIIDLTLLFGSGNEPTSTSDPRIAWIEAYAEEHPEYNAGEIIHGKVKKIEELNKPFYYIPNCNIDTTGTLVTHASYSVFVKDVSIGDSVLSGVYTYFNDVPAIGDSSSTGTRWLSATSTASHKYVAFRVSNDDSNATLTINGTQKIYKISDANGYKLTTYPIPAEVQALEGYGWMGNYIDFKTKEFVQEFGKKHYDSTADFTECRYSSSNEIVFSPVPYNTTVGVPTINGSGIAFLLSGAYFREDGTSMQLDAFKAYVDANGLDVYYPLATAIRTDISQYITDEWQTIETEPNGSITFTNDNLLPVPIKDSFMVKLSEALA